jgi:hypothetical protein
MYRTLRATRIIRLLFLEFLRCYRTAGGIVGIQAIAPWSHVSSYFKSLECPSRFHANITRLNSMAATKT